MLNCDNATIGVAGPAGNPGLRLVDLAPYGSSSNARAREAASLGMGSAREKMTHAGSGGGNFPE